MNNLIMMRKRLYTRNLVPGKSVYNERLERRDGVEYREWEADRSKLGAGIMKGIKNPINTDSKVLYLGAASGTTVSHVSDLASDGRVYAVEFAPEPMKQLIMLAKDRRNIIPYFADANHPEEYKVERVDVIFQDIAQRNQVEIFTKNCAAYLKGSGLGLLVIKSRSIDVTRKPFDVFKEVERELKNKFRIISKTRLEPYEHDHMLFVLKKK